MAQELAALRVLFILKHVLRNSVKQLSKKLYLVSDKMFHVSAINCKLQTRVPDDYDTDQ